MSENHETDKQIESLMMEIEVDAGYFIRSGSKQYRKTRVHCILKWVREIERVLEEDPTYLTKRGSPTKSRG